MFARYKRPPFLVAGFIVAALPGYLALTMLIERSPIAAGVFAFMALLVIGFGSLLAGKRP